MNNTTGTARPPIRTRCKVLGANWLAGVITIILAFGALSLTRFGDTSLAAFCVIWGILCLAYYQLAFLFTALPAHLHLFTLGKPGIVLKLWSLIGGALHLCSAGGIEPCLGKTADG